MTRHTAKLRADTPEHRAYMAHATACERCRTVCGKVVLCRRGERLLRLACEASVDSGGPGV